MKHIRVNITLPIELNDKLDKYVKSTGRKKSFFIAVLLNNYFKRREEKQNASQQT